MRGDGRSDGSGDRRRADVSAARCALASFRGAGLVTEGSLLARLFVAPLGPLDRHLRGLRGRVLSLGCGLGVVDRYLAEINPDVHVDGLDLDAARIAVANRTAAAAPRVAARVADLKTLPPGGYDAAIAVDVLDHSDPELHVTLPDLGPAIFVDGRLPP